MATEHQSEGKPRNWRKILEHEMIEYFLNFVFLAGFLAAFTWYRRLILAEYHIQYLAYWAPLIEAAILAKIIMIGDMLRIGRRFRNRPLVVTTLYRAVVYSILVVIFSFVEHIVDAWIHGKRAREGIAEIASKGPYEILAWFVVLFAAFVPFFAIKEMQRVFGAEKIRHLFLRGPAAAGEPIEGKGDAASHRS